jgi:hypothetical protein
MRLIDWAFWSSGGYPFPQKVKVRIRGCELFAATVRHGTRAFFEQQTVLWKGHVYAAIHKFAGKPKVVGVGIITKKG